MRGIVIALAVLPLVACAGFTSPSSRPGAAPGADAGAPSDDGGTAVVSGGDAQNNSQPPPPGQTLDGIFVSSSKGADASADGTAAKPFHSLAAAIPVAVAAGKRVIACNESFNEALTLTNGVSIYGAYDCTQTPWAPSQTHARVAAPSSPALVANEISLPTRIDGVDMVAPDQTAPQASSIAVMATNAPALVLANLTVHAGNAGGGVDGVEGPQLSNAASVNGLNAGLPLSCGGTGASCTNPVTLATRYWGAVAGGTNVCAGAPGFAGSPGGFGASGATVVCTAINNPVLHVDGDYDWLQVAPGAATPASANNAGPSGDGAQGLSGASGSSAMLGELTASGFVSGDGTPGANGGGGQGGGGGGAQPPTQAYGTSAACLPLDVGVGSLFGNGPGGGAGGCPGLAGSQGSGGGASVAIYSVNSPLTLVAAKIETASGGSGGKGTFGSDPTPGGAGGLPGASIAAGGGGTGGVAGVSGSGAGGPSIGIAHTGISPVYGTDTVFAVGQGGGGVDARVSADGAKTIPASSAGQSSNDVAF